MASNNATASDTRHPARAVVTARTTSGGGDAGRLLLRLAVGVLILLHGIAKLSGGVGGISGMLAQHGLPPWVAYGAYIGEVLAPLLVIIGLWTRPAALVIAVNMVFALWLAHAGQLLQLTKNGGWAVELQGMYLFAALSIALLGAGAYSVGGAAGRAN